MTDPGLPPAAPGWAREVVARRALVVTAVTALVHVAVVLWALPPTLEAQAPVAVGSVIDLLGVLALVLWSRQGVTPADPSLGPTAATGQPLTIDHGPEHARPPLGRPHATGNVRKLGDEEGSQ